MLRTKASTMMHSRYSLGYWALANHMFGAWRGGTRAPLVGSRSRVDSVRLPKVILGAFYTLAKVLY